MPCLCANLAQNSREFPTELLPQIHVEYRQRMIAPSVRQILREKFFRARRPKSKVPRAGLRVNGGAARATGG
jgi:autonomous glycyl radical cofactor GrcA